MSIGWVAVMVTLVVVGSAMPWRLGPRQRLKAVTSTHLTGDTSRAATHRTPRPDVVLVLDLLDVAVGAGVSIPRALEAVGGAAGGTDGARLRQVAAELLLGARWPTAWAGVAGPLVTVGACLEDSWERGSAPGPALRARAESLRRERRRAAREAAGRLGVRLVLPLGLCFLPAFVLLGLVPAVVSFAAGLLA